MTRAVTLLCVLCIFTAVCTGRASAKSAKELIPMGVIAGIKMQTQGLTVAGLSEVDTPPGTSNPAKTAGLREGDMLISADGIPLCSSSELKRAVDSASGAVELEVLRGGRTLRLQVDPCTDRNGEKKLGILVRDSVLGIGTITYFDPDTGQYGALGHGVSDASGSLIPIQGGILSGLTLNGITHGEKGSAGELKGNFTDETLGTLERNTAAGIFGEFYSSPSSKALPICADSQIKLGGAKILSAVSGNVESYDIRIRAIYRGNSHSGRDMLIEITDSRLIELTGGIVRGMSGSPIIQDGKFVGAVTHVLVNDPHKGYAISAEHMLEASEKELPYAA